MTVISAASATVPVPDTTVTDRCGSQCSISRRQLSFSDAGQTTTAGKASSASSVASACTVLPSPCSSARNARRASSAYATPARWNGRSSPPSRDSISSDGPVVRPRAPHAVDRLLVLASAGDRAPRGRSARGLDPVDPQVVLERLEQIRIDRQRATVRLAGRQRQERRDRLRVPVDVEREARLADALHQRQRRRRRAPARPAGGSRSAARAGRAARPASPAAPRPPPA